MNWLVKLRVKTKLIGGFLIVAAIAAIIGGVGINSTSRVNAMATQMYEYEMLGMNHAGSASTQFTGIAGVVRSALLALSMTERRQELQRMDERFKKTKAELAVLDDLFVTENGKALVQQAREAVLAYEASIGRVVAVLNTEAPGEAIDSLAMLARDARPLGDAADALMEKLVTGKLENAQGFAKQISVIYGNTQILLIALTVGGALLAILLGVAIAAYLARQLGGEPRDAARVAGAIANGDLTNQIDMSKAGLCDAVDAGVATHGGQFGARKQRQYCHGLQSDRGGQYRFVAAYGRAGGQPDPDGRGDGRADEHG